MDITARVKEKRVRGGEEYKKEAKSEADTMPAALVSFDLLFLRHFTHKLRCAFLSFFALFSGNGNKVAEHGCAFL